MNRFILSADECAILIVSLQLVVGISEEEVARGLAQNYWHNHAKGMTAGDPLDIPGVRLEVMQSCITYYQPEFALNAKE